MKLFTQISVLIIAVQWCCEVKCSKPFLRKKHIHKIFHLGFVPLPPKHFSLEFEKFTPFGPFEFKHTIKKRQIAQAELSSVTNEVLAVQDAPLKIPMTHLLEKADAKNVGILPAEVLITSVVEPLEPGKQISFLLPVDSEVVITPAVKDVLVPVSHAVEVPVSPEPELKPEVVTSHSSAVVEITPKPVDILPPPEVQPIKPNVVLTTSIENNIPPVPPGPPLLADPDLNTPVISPVINSYPIAPFLYTNIKGTPFYTPASNIIPFINPAAVTIPEAVLPPAPPPVVNEVVPVVTEEKPPVVIEEIPPVVKEEPPPNFFVKSSRFVIYLGSMMLQMLSRFVNGEINLNRIPLPPPLPGIQ